MKKQVKSKFIDWKEQLKREAIYLKTGKYVASGLDEAWMCYYFDAKAQKNMVITAMPMTKHQAQAHARAANKYYAGRQLVQVCQIPEAC